MKKLLALVLAMVMTLGLATVSSSAAYSDAADVSLNEAVDVMSAVGVFQGADGKFSPKANLNREQAAKLIAYLDLGEDTAEALPAVKVFSDVPVTSWSAKYIAYCADAGYIAGDGTGKFNPAGELNGYAFGKMVLCVLGYDADIEGFVGNNWSIAVAKLMESNDIADGVSGAASATLTREQAAQYCLNALKADMVEYDTKGTSIDINGAKIATGASKAESVVDKTDVAKHNVIGAEVTYDDQNKIKAGSPTVTTVQLGEKLYDGKLELAGVAAADDLGRPAHGWSYKDEKIGTYADDSDVTIVAPGDKTYAKLLDAENLEVAAGTKVTNKANEDAEVNYNGDATPTAGTVLELYKTNGKVSKIVAYAYKLAEVKKVTTLKSDSDLGKKGATVKYTLDGAGALTYVDNLDKTVVATQEIGTWAKGDMLAVVVNHDGKLAYVAKADEVQGACSAYTTKSYTIAGTKYNFANTYTDANGIGGNVDFKKGEYKLYLDPNQYIIGSEVISGVATANAEDIVYVIADVAAPATNGEGESVYYVRTISMTGEYKVYQTSVNPTNINRTTNGLLYVVSTDADDNYVFAKAADGTKLTDTIAHIDNDAKEYFTETKLKEDTSFKKDTKSVVAADNSTKVYLTNDTVYLFEDAAKTTQITGGVDKTVTATSSTILVAKDADGNPIAKAVILAGTKYVETVDANTIYVKGEDAKTGTNANGNEFTAYDLTGEKITITLKSATSTTAGFYKYTMDADGVYTLEAVDTKATTNSDNGQKAFNNVTASKFTNTLTITGAIADVTMADDMVIVDLADGVELDTVSDLCDMTKITGSVLVMDKTVKMIVVTAATAPQN